MSIMMAATPIVPIMAIPNAPTCSALGASVGGKEIFSEIQLIFDNTIISKLLSNHVIPSRKSHNGEYLI